MLGRLNSYFHGVSKPQKAAEQSLAAQTIAAPVLRLWSFGGCGCVSCDSAERCNYGHIQMKEWNSLQNKGIIAYELIRD